MRMIPVLLVSLAVTSCGTAGEPLWLATIADRADPCQRPPQPSWCGASAGVRVYQHDWVTGGIVSTWTTPQRLNDKYRYD